MYLFFHNTENSCPCCSGKLVKVIGQVKIIGEKRAKYRSCCDKCLNIVFTPKNTSFIKIKNKTAEFIKNFI